MENFTPKEVKILETVEDIQERREQVLSRYNDFKIETRQKREKLEDSRRFQYFKRDADELESWIHEKLQAASEESYRDPTNLQAKIQKHQAFEAEVSAHSNAIVSLDNTGQEMINQQHFAQAQQTGPALGDLQFQRRRSVSAFAGLLSRFYRRLLIGGISGAPEAGSFRPASASQRLHL